MLWRIRVLLQKQLQQCRRLLIRRQISLVRARLERLKNIDVCRSSSPFEHLQLLFGLFYFILEVLTVLQHFLLPQSRLPFHEFLVEFWLSVVKHALKEPDSLLQTFQSIVELRVLGTLLGLDDCLLHIIGQCLEFGSRFE